MKRILAITGVFVLVIVIGGSMFLLAGSQGLVRLPTRMIIVSHAYPELVSTEYDRPMSPSDSYHWVVRVGYVEIPPGRPSNFHFRTLLSIPVPGNHSNPGIRPIYLWK